MKGKIVVTLLGMALIAGILSGCVEQQPPAPENQAPEASFTYSPTTIYVNTTNVTFTDTSTDDGTIVSWEWDLGDGTTATTQNVTHMYTSVGTYTVTLKVTDDQGVNDTATQYITVSYNPPSASFSYQPQENITVNTTITFTDNSTQGDAAIVNYTWNFGDGNISYERNTTHIYSAAGNYTVTLTVEDENGLTDTETATITVEE
ncbi:MAG: hypothetical protein DRN08_05095 [Thermoplasmata archaeon]|nr:MAG: hypothetical protein DRN05_06335 [Thermoplasmata archaeon]RLF33884.1 MAG: hypothetical protein DRN08_05095 [Thermoplasmata archaeon]